jgi:antitoxin component YwqK of YwqJK toxin-antitoxin module
MKRKLILYVFLFAACKQEVKQLSTTNKTLTEGKSIIIPDTVVDAGDGSLHLENGVWFWRDQPFSGTMERYYSNGKLQFKQSFYLGKEEGWQFSYYENGNKDAQRYYHLGEKDSVNLGWWINGNLRYEYHFKAGTYEGDFKEWYQTGKPLKWINYHDGKEQWGKGWRENGKPYMSFVMKGGRLYGQINPNLCYTLKDEKGEFRDSQK